MQLIECINFLLSKAQQNVLQQFKTYLEPYGVTPVQYGILKCLWEQDGQTPKQIGERLSLDGSTITGILDRMETKELVKRVPDSEDRRALRVMLTPRGNELQHTVEKAIEVANEAVLKPYSPEERLALKSMLELIADPDAAKKSGK